MYRTRRYNSPLGVEHDEYSAQEPIPRVTNTAHHAQIRFTDPSVSEPFWSEPIIGVRSANDEQTQRARSPSLNRSIRPQRCTASKAARIRQAEYEAAERLAAIKIREMQLEAYLVQKQLEADIAKLLSVDQGNTRGTEEASNVNVQVEDWLRHAGHCQREPTYNSLPAQRTRLHHAATPVTTTCTNNNEPKPEQCRLYLAATPVVTTCRNNTEPEPAMTPVVTTCTNITEPKPERHRSNQVATPATNTCMNNTEPKLESRRSYHAAIPTVNACMNNTEPKPERRRPYHATTPAVTTGSNNTELKPERRSQDLRVNSPLKYYPRTEHHRQKEIFEMLRPNKSTPTVTLNQNEPQPRSTRTASQTHWKNTNANVFNANDVEKCMCCGGDHEPPQCIKIEEMSVNARWNWAKINKVCFKCLRNRHQRADCKANQCGIDDCIHSHHPLLHEHRPRSEASNTNSNASLRQAEVVASTSSVTKSGSNVILTVCPIIATNFNGDDNYKYGLLNVGSTISLIEEDPAAQLNLKGPSDTLNIRSLHCTEWKEKFRRVQLKLRGKRTRSSHVMRFRTVKRFHVMHQNIPQELLCHDHLQNLDPSEICYQQARPRMLISSNNWKLIISKQLLTGGRNEPAALRTEPGRVKHGTGPQVTIPNGDHERVLHLRAVNCSQKVKLNEAAQLQLPWYYNTRGVRSFQSPFCKIIVQKYIYNAKIALQIRTKTSVEQEGIRHLELTENLRQQAAQKQSFTENGNLVRAGQVIQRSRRLVKLDPILQNRLLHLCGRTDSTMVPNIAKRPIISEIRHPVTRLMLTPDRFAVGPVNSERTANVIHQKCWVIIQRARRKKVALKCFASCARRPKRAAAGWLYSNPREVLDCRSDPRDPVACNGHYVMADERCIPTSTQRQLQKNTLEEIDIRSITRTLGGVFQRTIKKLAVLTKN